MNNNRLFAAVNQLIPILELKNLRRYFNKFNYPETEEYIKSAGLDMGDFYFKRDDPFACFCYYRDHVLIDIPIFTREALKSFQTVELIKFEEGRLKDCLDRKDFRTFFYLVDKRVAILAFQKLFDVIPDEDKYETFWFIYARCGLSLNDFTEEYIHKIIEYRKKPLNLPDDGYLEIYRGQGTARTTPVNMEHSWTLDINTAIKYAVHQESEGKVYKARINKRDAAAYIKRKNEKEIIVFPAKLQGIKEIDLVSLSDLQPQMESLGITDRYHEYEQQLKKEYFYRPDGTHGIMHTRRVLFLNLIMSCFQNFDERMINILCTAALYHDIGRINDNFDPHHGIESYKKAEEKGLITMLDGVDREIVRYIIENHCINDKLAQANLEKYDFKDRKESEFLFNTFKDADGLDRVRINDLDFSHLRTDYGRKLLLVARQLYNHFDLFVS